MADLSRGLEVSNLHVSFGKRRVLTSVDLQIRPGEVVALVGHNGAGKSTLLKTLAGVVHPAEGSVRIQGSSILTLTTSQRIGLGLTYLPQGNPVFGHLNIRENLRLRVGRNGGTRAVETAITNAIAEFPGLAGRENQLAGTLSGGEKQMLALAGALLSRPKYLLLDEPSSGLAPVLVSATLDRVRDLAHLGGLGILLVEQRIRDAVRVGDRVIVLRQGRIVYEGSGPEINDRCVTGLL